MTQSQSGIQVNNLQTVSTLSNTASILALTDAVNNNVGLIDKNNLASSLVSTTSGNGLTVDSNGLKVPNIGTLANLTTADKTSVVNAINSLKTETAPNIINLPSSGTISLATNTINTLTNSASVVFSLPATVDTTQFNQIFVFFRQTGTYSVSLGTGYYFSETEPNLAVAGYYDIIFEYDPIRSGWAVGAIKKG